MNESHAMTTHAAQLHVDTPSRRDPPPRDSSPCAHRACATAFQSAGGTVPLHRARGAALLEGLIAFAVLALATLSIVRLQSTWSIDATIAQQRSQALRFGQREIESLRAFTATGAASGARSYDDIVSAVSTLALRTEPFAQASYAVTRAVTSSTNDHAKSVDVIVAWTDRRGEAQHVALHTLIARADPVSSGALHVGSNTPPVRGAKGRSVLIPLAAVDLRRGRSALRLGSASPAVVLLDNRTGAVVARCEVDTARRIDGLTAAETDACVPVAAQLLSGIVRFAQAGWTPLQRPDGAPLPLTIALALDGGTYAEAPVCTSEPLKVVTFTVAGVTSSSTVPIDALPASVGASAWVETDRLVAYRCIVVPRADGRWSGRSRIVPDGWRLGLGIGGHRVCRYISDSDHSGAIDRNVEHPDAYVDVKEALMQQNFLVVPGNDACPDQPDRGDPRLASTTTAPHQP